jgi:hypothetical protein
MPYTKELNKYNEKKYVGCKMFIYNSITILINMPMIGIMITVFRPYLSAILAYIPDNSKGGKLKVKDINIMR